MAVTVINSWWYIYHPSDGIRGGCLYTTSLRCWFSLL